MSTDSIALRDHPLMTYHGAPNWPPTWVKTSGSRYATLGILHGEIGSLYKVAPSKIEPITRCYLLIDFEEEPYMGALLFEDAATCRQLLSLLQKHLGESITQIGSLDLSHML